MKTIMTIAAGVLCSTLAFADGTNGLTGSSMAVTNSGSGLIKVFYKAQTSGRVTVSIMNDKDEKVFSERMKAENFMRPYNFKNLPTGQYTIQVEDAEGVHTEKIEYGMAAEKKVNVSKIDSNEARYMISGYVTSADKINITIYNADSKVLYQDKLNVDGKFAKVYNLSAVKGAFTIEVSDTNGSLKEFNSAE